MLQSIRAGFCAGDQMRLTDDGPSAEISIKTEEMIPLDLHTVKVHAQAALASGTHELVLTDRAVKLEVPDDAGCQFEFSCLDNAQKHLSIEKLSLIFQKPVRLVNLFTTLDETRAFLSTSIRERSPKDGEDSAIPKVNEFLSKAGEFLGRQAENLKKTDGFKKAEGFWEKTASQYLDKIAETKGWKTIVAAAEKTSELSPVALEKSKDFLNMLVTRGEEAIDRAMEGVSVSQLDIEAHLEKSGARLAFYVTGEIVFHEKMRVPMEKFELPSIFFTRFDAGLRELLSQFCVSTEQGTSISRTVLGMLKTVEGRLDYGFVLSPFDVEIQARGGRTCSLGLNSNWEYRGQAQFVMSRRDGDISVQMQGSLTDSGNETVVCRLDLTTTDGALVSCGEKLSEHIWTLSMLGDGQDVRGHIVIEEGSRVFLNRLALATHDPWLLHDLRMPFNLAPMPICGTFDFGVNAENASVHLHAFDMNLNGGAAWDTAQAFDLGRVHTEFSRCEGNIALNVNKSASGQMQLNLNVDMGFDLDTAVGMIPLPELKLLSSEMHVRAAGKLHAHIVGNMETRNIRTLEAIFDGSDFDAEVERFDAAWDGISVSSEVPLQAKCHIDQAALNADGLSESVISCDWKSPKSPILSVGNAHCDLVQDVVCDGHIKARTSEQGWIHFEEGFGFYDAHFFNMVFYPEKEKTKLLAILEHEPLFEKIAEIVGVLSELTGPVPVRLIERIRVWVKKCRESGVILDFAHAAHCRDFARMISLFLFDDETHLEEIDQICENCLNGTGLDRYKAEELLVKAFPELDIPQVGQILRILDMIFRGMPYEQPEVRHEEALCDEYSHELRLLPSANQLFDLDTVKPEEFKELYKYGGPCLIDTRTTRNRIYKYAAGYTVAQLEWVLAHHGCDFEPDQSRKLEKLVAIKRRLQKQEPREGSFFVQDFNIDYFLQAILDAEEDVLPRISDLTDCLDDFTERCSSSDVAECFASWIVPEDAGRLLAAGISSRSQGQLVQLNQARILDYLVKRGRLYALASFYESSSGSDRVLASLLMSFLSQDQSLMKTQVDRVSVLTDLLGIDIPRRSDFLSGGSRASESYYEQLCRVANEINHSVTMYEAAKLRMQSDRIATDSCVNEESPKRPPYVPSYPDEDEMAELTRALEKADGLGVSVVQAYKTGEEPDADSVKKTEKAYQYAYRLASAILKKFPDVFMKPAFKKFYFRTYEALIIQTLDQNLLDDIDMVRRWFEVRSHISADEVSGLSRSVRRSAIIETLYYRDEDKDVRRNDPLTWIDIRPGERKVDLTILFAPGVITDGSQGCELKTAFARLEEQRGIRVVRADTGNIKPLAYNSEIIQEAMRTIHSPFMMLGYSQGCANMMRAESQLYASTPDDRAVLDNLVARHFMCSALNGSPLAIWGFGLYQQTLIEGEKCLKTISAVSSQSMSDLTFEALRKILDAPMITRMLNSIEALSFKGLSMLSRDSQYTPGVINTEFQGVLCEYVPEGLNYTYYHFLSQAPGLENDSQVSTDCAHSYHVYNRNASVDILRDESIPSCTKKAHHWNPLYDEVALAESEQDVRDAVYHAPKDIHIVPPVEALMLFGRI